MNEWWIYATIHESKNTWTYMTLNTAVPNSHLIVFNTIHTNQDLRESTKEMWNKNDSDYAFHLPEHWVECHIEGNRTIGVVHQDY